MAEYLNGCLANWPRGNTCWHFESQRYFGSKGLEYQKTRWVPLLPKAKASLQAALRENDVTLGEVT